MITLDLLKLTVCLLFCVILCMLSQIYADILVYVEDTRRDESKRLLSAIK